MKKLLSIILSVLMVISCMTCMLSVPASAVTTVNSYITFNQQGANLLADFDADNLLSASPNCQNRDAFQNLTTSDSKAGGNAIKNAWSTHYQAFYIPLLDADGNSLLEVGRTYTLNFYLKTIVGMQVARIHNTTGYSGDSGHCTGADTVREDAMVTLTAGAADADGWVQYSATFTPALDLNYDIYLYFGNGGEDAAGTNSFIISDLNLYTHDVRMGADVVGNGAVKATAGTNSISLTATPYQDAEFIGWYDGETELSTSATFTYNYDTVAEKYITAKFTGINLVADKVSTDWKSYNAEWRHVDNYNREVGVSYLGGNSAKRHYLSYQMMYLPVELQANTEYSFQTYISDFEGSNIVAETVKVFKDSDIPEGFSGNIAEDGEYGSANGYFANPYRGDVSITGWTAFPPTPAVFTTEEAGTYLIGVKFSSCTDANGTGAYDEGIYALISDWSLTPTAEVNPDDTFTVAVSSTGNGAAKASATSVAAYQQVTLTATSYLNSTFLGWYDGETLISTDKVYNHTVTSDVAFTAKFEGENLLAGKNVANAQQTSETENTTGGTIYSAVTDTEGWWSNGWPQGKYAASTDSHLGGASITNPSTGYQAHVYTMLLKPNTKYSVEFSVKSTGKVRRLWLLTNDAVFGYSHINNGKETGGKWNSAPGTHAIDWINDKDTDLSEWTRYSHTFTTNDSDAEVIPYYLYADFIEGQVVTSDYASGIYFSDLSLVEEKAAVTISATAKGKGAATVSNTAATLGSTVVFTATPYQNATFKGWYDGDTLVSRDAVYSHTVEGSVSLTAKFTGINLAADIKTADWYSYNSNGTVNCHQQASTSAGDSALGGNSVLLSEINYGYRYFWLDLEANTEYNVSYYLKAYGSSDTVKLDAKLTTYLKSEIENYSLNKDAVIAAGGLYNNLWEFRPNLTPDYCTYRQECGGSYTATTEFTELSTTFTTAEAGTYIIMVKFAAVTGQANISDMCVSPVQEDKVSVEGNGTVKSNIEELDDGKKVTAVATAYQDSRFIGWYEGETLVSTDTEYTNTYEEAISLTAKFTDVNLAQGLNTVANWKKGEYSWVKIGNANDQSLYGGNAVNFTGLVSFQAAYLPITLKSGNEYSISFAYKVTGSTSHYISLFGPDLEISTGNDKGGMQVGGTEIKNFLGEDIDVEVPEYKIYTATFTTPASTNATEVYNLYVKHNNPVGTTEDYQEAVLSDISIIDLSARYNVDFAEFTGNSIRTTGSQALRYSYSVDESIITEGYMGYTVKEIGIVAIRTKYLNGLELKPNTQYIYNEIPHSGKIGVVYNEEFNGFAATEGGRMYFNIALTNIGVNALDNSIRYDAYGDDYTVRAYMIVTDGTKEYTYYDDAVDASVFAVMNTIITAYESTSTPSAQLTSDYNSIMAIINSTVTDAKGRTVKECYEAKYPAN